MELVSLLYARPNDREAEGRTPRRQSAPARQCRPCRSRRCRKSSRALRAKGVCQQADGSQQSEDAGP